MSVDTSRSQVWLHIAQVHRMQREKVCAAVLDEQLRTLAGVLQEHLDAVKTEQLNGYLYGGEGRSMNNETTTKRLEEIIWEHVPGTDESFPTRAAQDIIAEFVFIPRADLPEVVDMDAYLAVSGENMIKDFPGGRNRELGLAHLAVAEYKAAQKQTDNEAKRDRRRDELAREFSGKTANYATYGNLGGFAQRAVDRIIELEDAA